jgi:hypothetical protein
MIFLCKMSALYRSFCVISKQPLFTIFLNILVNYIKITKIYDKMKKFYLNFHYFFLIFMIKLEINKQIEAKFRDFS